MLERYIRDADAGTYSETIHAKGINKLKSPGPNKMYRPSQSKRFKAIILHKYSSYRSTRTLNPRLWRPGLARLVGIVTTVRARFHRRPTHWIKSVIGWNINTCYSLTKFKKLSVTLTVPVNLSVSHPHIVPIAWDCRNVNRMSWFSRTMRQAENAYPNIITFKGLLDLAGECTSATTCGGSTITIPSSDLPASYYNRSLPRRHWRA